MLNTNVDAVIITAILKNFSRTYSIQSTHPNTTTNPTVHTQKKKKLCFSWICDVFNKPKCELDYDSAQRDLSWDIYYTKGIDQKPKKT